jgi:divalent metal cation (Fe/Co/Zn/Cd) transporter
VDVMKKRDKELTVPRSVAIATLIIAMVCVLAMARHTDREIKQAKQEAQEAEARSADAILKLIKTKDMYTRKLEELRSCDYSK